MKKVRSWKELTLREKIGQTVISLCETDKHIEMCGSIEKFLEKYPIGGVFNNGGLVKGLLVGANAEFKTVLKEYNKHLRVPLFGTADHGVFAQNEGVELPPQMALGATDDEELAYSAGAYMAENYKKTGINWGFWPVCDINMSKQSPHMDTRSVSDRYDLVTKITKAEIKAMKDKGVISAIKHYPGAPYNEFIDPHLAPCDNEFDMDMWMATYGKMYKELFEAGAPVVMTAHINLVNYQTEKADDRFSPATLSYEITTKLLREELGFKGVTLTDALVMGGFSGIGAVENTIKSFLAGNDVLLWPAYEYIDEMERRILSGEIDIKLLDAAVERIWNLKKEYGIIDEEDLSSDKDISYFSDITDAISKKSITLVSDEQGMLPVKPDEIKNLLIVGVTPDDKQYESICALKEIFEGYGCNVKMQRNIWTDEAEKAGEKYDLIIYALCRSVHRPIGPMDFWGDEATSIWSSNCSDKSKTLVVSFGTPYLYRYYKNSKLTYINAYSWARSTLEAFAKAVLGEIEFEGKSAVEL